MRMLFTVTYEAGEGETTDFTVAAPTYPKEWLPLTSEWSGTITCRLDAATGISAVGTTKTVLSLYVTGGNFGYEGSAFATSAAITVDVNGIPELVVSFRGSGALTIGGI